MHDNSRNKTHACAIQSNETIRIIRFPFEKKKNHIYHRSFVAIKHIIESAFKYFQNFYSI